MLRIVQIEEIEGLLFLLPDLVQQQQQRSPDFASNVSNWLSSLEEVFTSNRLYLAGNMAALRSGLVSVEQGQVPSGIEFRTRASRSRVVAAVASQALQRAAEMTSALLAENRSHLSEAEQIARQIVASAKSRGLITRQEPETSTTQYLQFLRRELGSNEDLENGFIMLEGLVGPQDTLVLIDQMLSSY
jgi:hypothetical protein